jgi:hypothetical protein
VLLKLADRLFRILCSLKLAVVVMLTLATAMTAATVIESLYDIRTGQYWVYRAGWFYFMLFLLGANILTVALSRWPWKRRHGPFLMAHLGILMLLFGSWVTWKYGLDGSMRLVEGQASAAVELDQPEILITDGNSIGTTPIRWTPAHAEFKPVTIPAYGLVVDRFITAAEPKISFLPAEPSDKSAKPALKVLLSGGPMRIRQEYWLWLGDPGWTAVQAGPAFLRLLDGSDPDNPNVQSRFQPQRALGMPPGPELDFTAQADGSISWWTRSSSGEQKKGKIPPGGVKGQALELPWKGGVKLEVLEYLPSAVSRIDYFPSRIQYGPQAPPSAIHLVAGNGGPGQEMWLGMGDRAVLSLGGRDVTIVYQNQRQMLPFSVRLERFQIDYYDGMRDPKEYASTVSVAGGSGSRANVLISMNEPLHHDGITFYQASFEPGEPRPTVSILSVNRDPGRQLKYWGSLLIVLGSVWLFWRKVQQAKQAKMMMTSPKEARA